MKHKLKVTHLVTAVALALGVAAHVHAASPGDEIKAGGHSFFSLYEGAPLLASSTEFFSIDTAGDYRVTLYDYLFDAPFTFLRLLVAGGSLGGSPITLNGTGSTQSSATFAALPGNYSITVHAIPGVVEIVPGIQANSSTYAWNVTMIPEPGTWAMMAIGLGLVGWQLRRRSKIAAASRFV